MENYIFMVTHRGDRTNIMAGFQVLDKQGFIKYLKSIDKKGWREQYRYSKIGGYAGNLKEMQLSEFNNVFLSDDFTPEQVTELFRKNISEVYGLHKQRNELKNLSSKDLIRGGIYKKSDGDLELYLGDVKRQTIKQPYSRFDREEKLPEECGKGWKSLRYENIDFEKGGILENMLKTCDVLKTNRKVVEFTGKIIELPNTATHKWSYGYYNKDEYTAITSLV